MLVWRNNAVQTVCEKTFHILPRIACLSAMGHITGGWRRRWRWRCTVHRERGTSQGFTTTSSLSPPVCWNLACCAWVVRICTLVLALVPDFCVFVIMLVHLKFKLNQPLVCWKTCCAMGGRDLLQCSNATMLCICNGRRCGFATMGLQQTPTVIQCHPSISDGGARLAIYQAVRYKLMQGNPMQCNETQCNAMKHKATNARNPMLEIAAQCTLVGSPSYYSSTITVNRQNSGRIPTCKAPPPSNSGLKYPN